MTSSLVSGVLIKAFEILFCSVSFSVEEGGEGFLIPQFSCLASGFVPFEASLRGLQILAFSPCPRRSPWVCVVYPARVFVRTLVLLVWGTPCGFVLL